MGKKYLTPTRRPTRQAPVLGHLRVPAPAAGTPDFERKDSSKHFGRSAKPRLPPTRQAPVLGQAQQHQEQIVKIDGPASGLPGQVTGDSANPHSYSYRDTEPEITRATFDRIRRD